jgi:tetratricopeptide (TPR) repeat protein
LLFLVAVMLLVTWSCGSEKTGDVPPETVAPDPARGEIPHPVLDDMEPLVATELADRRQDLDVLLIDDSASELAKGRSLGRMGQLYQAHRLLDVAEECYRQASARDSENHAWPYYHGILASNRGDLVTAGAAFETAIELAPGDVPAKIRLADLQMERGSFESSAALYHEALVLEPSLPAAEYGLGRLAAEDRDYATAIEHFKKALAMQPGASVIHYHLGMAYRQLGQSDAARDHLARSGQVRVAMADPLMQELSTLMLGASPHLTRGNAATREGRFAAGAAEYRKAVEVDPDNLRARQSLASALLRLGDLEGALEHFEAAVKLAPSNARAQSDLGTVLAEIGDTERAVHHLRLAVELEPALERAQLNLANNLIRMGEFDEALAAYRRILESDPTHLEARSRLGTALARAGRLEEGIAELRAVSLRDPGNARVHLNLGVALAERGDLQSAIDEHLTVLTLDPDRERLTLTHFNLGTFCKRANDPVRAEEHYRRALGLDNGLVDAHLDLGEILSADGRFNEAFRHYSRAAEIRPDSVRARLGAATSLMSLHRWMDARRVLEDGVATVRGDRRLAHALARLLAACPDRSIRDGQRSLALASGVFDAERTPWQAETLAMALAEVGRFNDAAQLQRRVRDEFKRISRTFDLDRVEANLARYENRENCCATSADVLPPS